MIAERDQRRGGLGVEAAALMMRFGLEQLHLARITAKVGLANTASLRMFEDRLRFALVSDCRVFNERTLALRLNDDSNQSMITALTPVYECCAYENGGHSKAPL